MKKFTLSNVFTDAACSSTRFTAALLLLEGGYTADRKTLATERRQAFLDPPDRPNMVWQLDFSAAAGLTSVEVQALTPGSR